MKFIQLKKDIEEFGARNIYLFEGFEAYFTNKGEEMLKQKYITQPELNYTVFSSENLKGEGLINLKNAVNNYPFLSEKRMVCAYNFYPTEAEYESVLKPVFENPNPTTILLIVNSKPPKTKYCDLKKKPNVTFVDCSKAEEETVIKWVYLTLKKEGISASRQVCEMVANFCLCDMSRVSKETEKLIAYAKQAGTLSENEVEDIVYQDSEYKIYEMTGALSNKNYSKFTSILYELKEKGMDDMGILNSLCNFFRNLYKISVANCSDREVATELGYKEYGVKKMREQAKLIGYDKVREFFDLTHNTLCNIKSGTISINSGIQLVLSKIFF